jgi:endonuclease YncB( thermonuclease family)
MSLRDEGLAGFNRRLATDFGSGYNVDAPRIHPDILLFKQTVWNDEAKRDAIKTEIDKLQKAYQARLGKFRSDEITRVDPSIVPGINARRSDLRLVNTERFKVQVEDADTIFLERRGWLNWLKARMGYGRIAMRLSGIDAPEISHEDDPLGKMGVKWHAEQPYGQEARKELKRLISGDVSIVTTAEPETYGRYLGAVIDEEGANVNLELIRRGAAKALPWGKAEKELVRRDLAADAEAEARDEQAGIWNYARYNVQSMIEDVKNREITFNMLTRLDVLAQRPSMALVASELAGLGEQGMAPYLRHMISDFGSSYQAVMAVSKWAVRFSESATARYLTQTEVKDMLVYLRSQIKNSQLLRVGRSSFGLEMTDAVLKENIAAIRKLEAAKGYKGGVMFLKQEHFIAIPDRRMRIEEIKRSVMHESFHAASANVQGMQEKIVEGRIPQYMIDILEVEGYGGGGAALEIAEGAATRRARLQEEAAAYMSYADPGTTEGIKAGVAHALHEPGMAEYIDELKRMHQAYITETPVVQARAGAARRNTRRSEMTKDIQKRHAPRIIGVRVDDSPGVEGMVFKMHNKRKGSHTMYHR